MTKYSKIGKKVTAVLLCACLSVVGSSTAMATTLRDAQNKKANAQQKLDSVTGQIQDIEGKQDSLQAEINALDAELVTTIANISILEEGIAKKQQELTQANADLEVARETEAIQYASMKERISYMYTNGGDVSFFNALFGANSFADALNRVSMFASVYDFDRELLTAYQETEAEIESLVNEIAEEQAAMQDQQADLEVQKASLDRMVSEKSAQMSDFDAMLASAKNLAAQYKSTIEEQNRVIAEEVAAQQRAEQERKAAEAAAAAAAANRKPATNNGNQAGNKENNASNTGNSTGNNSSSTGNNAGNTGNNSSDTSEKESGSSNSGSSASGSGSAVADYACNFIGNPYVWGGSSLTNGADCSGFVMSVYAHFGVSLPHSSYALRSVGRAVSPSEMQAGDIVCYEGHVAIYIGGGRIVHASNAKDGIKISPNYAYRTVVAIRRIF